MPLGFVQSPIILKPTLKPKKGFPKTYVLLGLVFLAFALYFSYQKSVKKDQNGEIIGISEAQQEKFRADSLRLTKCIQYALIAKSDGFYEPCNGQGKVFLFKGEIYKYGFTCEQNPEHRYSLQFYKNNDIRFLPQFYGNIFDCQVEEKRKLYNYPALPENIKRPEHQRLILPIGNCKTH